jgi:hypothetical protein
VFHLKGRASGLPTPRRDPPISMVRPPQSSSRHHQSLAERIFWRFCQNCSLLTVNITRPLSELANSSHRIPHFLALERSLVHTRSPILKPFQPCTGFIAPPPENHPQRWAIGSGRAELVAEASSVHPRPFNGVFYSRPPGPAPPPCGRDAKPTAHSSREWLPA